MKFDAFWLKAALFLIVGELMLPPMPYRRLEAKPESAPIFPVAPLASKAEQPKAKLSPEVVSAIAVPFIETLQNMEEIPFTMALPQNDPSLDQDPFFFRAQSWTKGTIGLEGDNDFAFRKDGDRLDIGIAGTEKIFSLKAPLRPIYADDTWVYLVADDVSFFEAKTPGEEPGEGLFLLSVNELHAGAKGEHQTPVYFLPLPGNEWTGKVEANSVEHTDTVLLTDHDGDTLPFLYKDIEKVIFGQKLNLMLALGAAARSAVITKSGNVGAVLPLAGSTAGFGMLFTGFDLDHPELNLFEGKKLSASFPALQKFWNQLAPQVAHADDNPNAKLIKNLIRVAVVTGLALTAAVVMKYTLYRSHFKKKHANEPPTGIWGKIKRQFKDIGDVFAHNLTFLSTVATNWFGGIL